LQDEPIIPGIDGMPVIAGILPIGLSPTAFAGPVPVTVGKAMDAISDGMLPVASMVRPSA